ncbi:hypothetical protein M413DRAFT_264482 [Hebeloma cylindrosporum]|uniref:Uncharacterized protein n=1 Tax=Hebeloma cylindrosporum TaxID=76867 RepID=A0A0C3CDK3_HEBCY|nr:hypothetical protein M413DRAFT_264482 [Hebeloma cylindrosporum h7]
MAGPSLCPGFAFVYIINACFLHRSSFDPIYCLYGTPRASGTNACCTLASRLSSASAQSSPGVIPAHADPARQHHFFKKSITLTTNIPYDFPPHFLLSGHSYLCLPSSLLSSPPSLLNFLLVLWINNVNFIHIFALGHG